MIGRVTVDKYGRTVEIIAEVHSAGAVGIRKGKG